ncbi:uncharacterized protein LOC127750209 [Frankliniella occidentalis]|uniref:Uncharacterized protein LOC127750209 n=1 Tax=Frankliniella occidentalis TaxID=133901 RepID=A0A9C6X0Z5_FRAOC|nr:uncharacterized protein LOC127750209 [Frankliniella occidentalis]
MRTIPRALGGGRGPRATTSRQEELAAAEGQAVVDKHLLSQALVDVRRALLDNGPGLWNLVFRHMQRTRFTLMGSVLMTLACLWELLQSPRAVAWRVPLRLLVGAFSSCTAHAVWVLRGHVAREALDKAVVLVRVLEQRGGPTKERLQAVGSRVRRTMLSFWWYISCSGVSVFATFLVDGKGLDVKTYLYSYLSVSCILGFYTLILLQQVLFTAAAELLFELPLPLEAEGGLGPVARVALLMSRAQDLCRVVDRVWRPLVPFLLLTVLLMPMLSTAEMVIFRGQTDMLAIGSLPAMVFVFVPLCFSGQRVKVRHGSGVRGRGGSHHTGHRVLCKLAHALDRAHAEGKPPALG